MEETQPARGGARDFHGRVVPEYAPDLDGEPDPGEIVWAWVPYEEDPERGKDRPVVIVGRAADDARLLVALMLTSKDHDGDARWHRIGAGSWDGEHRPSWVRVDRPLAVAPDAVRREGAILDPAQFLAVVERAAARPGGAARTHPRAGAPRRVTRLIGVYRANGGPLGEIAYVLGRIVRRDHCALCDVTHSAVRRRSAWDRLVARLGVPVELLHLDECTGEVRRLVPGRDAAPAVLVETDGHLELLLGAHELEAMAGSVEAFERALRRALADRSLTLG